MVIPFDKLPFEIFIESNKETYNNKNIIFYDSIEDLNRIDFIPKIKLKENYETKIKVSSETNVKLEMDGFDGVNINELKHDDGVYLSLKNKDITVFKPDNFPLPPGFYVLVVSVNNNAYYTGFEVIPLHLEQDNWEYMKNSVIEQLKLLALDIIQKKIFISQKYINKAIKIDVLLKMQVINEHYNKVMSALDDLITKSHNKIAKRYVHYNIDEIVLEDKQSYKLNNREKRPFVYKFGVQKYLDYNLSENRYIKKIVLELDRLILSFINDISTQYKFLSISINENKFLDDRNKAEEKRKIEARNLLLDFAAKAKKINYIINILKDSEWFKELQVKSFEKISTQSLFDPRYNILSKLSKDLKNNNIKYNIDNKFTFLCKRTDKLYEIYGFLKIFELLMQLGFETEKGLKVEQKDGEFKIYGLEEGDIFVLRRNDMKINVIYDKVITKSSNDTNLDNPIYTTGKHNRPDCRLDFFVNIKGKVYYLASLVIDFKYRKYNSLWNSPNNSKEQLQDYRYKISSKFFLNYGVLTSQRQRVVKEVWALYPDQDRIKDNDDSIKFISFIPKHEDTIKKYLSDFIENVERSEYAELKNNLKLES